MEIIHDLDDDESVAILQAVRRTAPPDTRLLVIEAIIPDDTDPDWSKLLDIHMLTLLGEIRNGPSRNFDPRSHGDVERAIDRGATMDRILFAAAHQRRY